MQPALRIEHLGKRYGPTVALADLSLSCSAGEVHALLGENGAGKTTLIKILSGLVTSDEGRVAIAGRDLRSGPPRALGVATVFQELSLVKDLSVAQNFLLGAEPLNVFGMIRRRELSRRVEAALAALEIADIDPASKVRDLDLPARQKVEIARAIARQPKVLLLDEPTASLSARDVQWLGGRLAALRAAGVAVLFISHRLAEVRAFCSRLTILRNGRDVATSDIAEMKDEEIVRLTIGRSVDAIFPPRTAAATLKVPERTYHPHAEEAAQQPSRSTQGLASFETPPSAALSAGFSHALRAREPQAGFAQDEGGPGFQLTGQPVLEVRGLSAGARLRDVSLCLRPGTITGVGALEDMGQRDLFLALFGLEDRIGGEIVVRGRFVDVDSPAAAISAGIGISLVPEDRKTEGLFLALDGAENATLPQIGRYARHGLVSRRRQRAAVAGMFAQVNLAERAAWDPASAFSGGNQQKIVLAKWLLTGAGILLLYDPTRGIDVGAKAEIFKLMRRFTEKGGAILFYSTEIMELVGMSDEVVTLYQGRVATRLRGDAITEHAIMAAALGQTARDHAA